MRFVAVVRREPRMNDNPLLQCADRHEIIPLRTEAEVLQTWQALVEHHMENYATSADIPVAGETFRMSPAVALIRLDRLRQIAPGCPLSIVYLAARRTFIETARLQIRRTKAA